MIATFDDMEDVAVPVPDGQISVWHRPARDAPTAVLVHGLSGNSRWWGSVIEHLPEEMGVVALDIRGRGESVDAPPPYDLTEIADDVARALDHLSIERAIVAGYSMGGWVVALCGAHHPQRVERLLLVDGGLPLPRDPGSDVEEIIEAIVGPSLRRFQVEFESREAYFDYWKGHPAFDRHWDDSMRAALGHELIAVGDHFEVRANPEAIRVAASQMIIDQEANAAAARSSVPGQLIVVERGTMDQPGGMIPRDVAEQTVMANPQLTMRYLPDLNHYTLILGEGAPSVAAAIASAS